MGWFGQRSLLRAAVTVVLVAGLAGCATAWGAPRPSEPRPRPRTGPEVTRLALPYATASPRQTLDLYLPAGDGRTVYPLVILIHGGAFLEGRSADHEGLARRLVAQGFAVASLNYRLSGEARFPAGVKDVKAAVRFLRWNAPLWGVDPKGFAAWGDSAGGYLAAMLGASGGDRALDDPALGFPRGSSAVQAVVSWYGPSDFASMDGHARAIGCDPGAQRHHAPDSPESRWLGARLSALPGTVEQASVVRRVRTARTLPPFLLVHGTVDCTVAPGQSTMLHDALRARKARSTLLLVKGAGHNDPLIVDGHVDEGVAFLRQVLPPR